MSERRDQYYASLEKDEEYRKQLLREQNEGIDEYNYIESRRRYIKEEIESTQKAYSNFCKDVKNMLVAEAIYSLYSPCIQSISETNTNLSKNLVLSYVEEKGVDNILMNMYIPKTYTLECVHRAVDKYYNIIIEKVDKKEKETLNVSSEDRKKFLDELNNEKDIENVKNAIALRVSNAEENFITSAMDDKLDLDHIITDTKTRLDDSKQDMNDENKEATAQEMANIAKQRMGEIRENKPRSIFEHMVKLLSESTLLNDTRRMKYINDEGKLDIGQIVESVRCIYGFMETLNTSKLETIDESYIRSVFENLK